MDNHIEGVPLVLESEWSLDLGGIEGDFCKLVLACADHRVMIFQQKTEENVQGVFDHLEKQITSFGATSRRDRYFLIGYDWIYRRAFQTRLIVK
jgi:hypothetical protein